MSDNNDSFVYGIDAPLTKRMLEQRARKWWAFQVSYTPLYKKRAQYWMSAAWLAGYHARQRDEKLKGASSKKENKKEEKVK